MSDKASSAPYAGVWSASPTPFDENLELDRDALPGLVEHHLRLGVRGLFLGGTAGEGMAMTEAQFRTLVRDVVRHNRGRMSIAVQGTDNSSARVLDNIARARDDGADIAVVAQPLFFMNSSERRLEEYYLEIFDKSPLPIGLYDRGAHSANPLTPGMLEKLLKHPRVVLLKDSSGDEEHRRAAFQARAARPELRLLNGDEFMTAEYMLAGYDGLLLGGAVFNGRPAGEVIAAAREGREADAREIGDYIRRINYRVFGGKSLGCWLAGEKRICMEFGIFNSWANYYGFTLTPECEREIVRLVREDGPRLLGE